MGLATMSIIRRPLARPMHGCDPSLAPICTSQSKASWYLAMNKLPSFYETLGFQGNCRGLIVQHCPAPCCSHSILNSESAGGIHDAIYYTADGLID